MGGIHYISCKTGENVQDLRSSLSQVVLQKGFLPTVSENWVKLHDFIRSLTAQNQTASRSHMEEWARMCGLKEEEKFYSGACRDRQWPCVDLLRQGSCSHLGSKALEVGQRMGHSNQNTYCQHASDTNLSRRRTDLDCLSQSNPHLPK